MKKINFKQPKYIIPLILFPFWSLFYYTFSQFKSKPKQEVKTIMVDSAAINPTIQDVGADVSNNNLPDKFKAFQDTYKQQSDSTAVKSLAPDNFQHAYDQDEAQVKSRHFLDSMTHLMNRHNEEFTEKMKATDEVHPQKSIRELPASEHKEDEMTTFKEQMAYIDSLQRARQDALDPERAAKPSKTPPSPDTIKALSVVKADAIKRQSFNTVFANTDKNFITAIIDEEAKSVEGSRLRFRLLDDIVVGDNRLITRGTYLYGFVTGFTSQRLIVTITGINNSGEILPVKLSIYDNDGLQGLYVPSSNFRDFTKDLGAGSASAITYSSTSTSTDALSQVTTGFIQQLFSGTTSAAQRLLKTNRATVKYSTVVYLVPEKH